MQQGALGFGSLASSAVLVVAGNSNQSHLTEKKTVERDDRKSDSDLGNGNGDAYIRDDPYMNMKETNLFKNDVEFEKVTRLSLISIFRSTFQKLQSTQVIAKLS